MFGARWLVGGGALLVAGVALYVLLQGGGPSSHNTSDNSRGNTSHDQAERHPTRVRELPDPALDDIDANSRKAMRDLLRRADGDE